MVCAALALFDEPADLTPLIILLSAIAAGWGVWSARRTARQRATLDLIEKVESTGHYRSLHSTFASRRRSNNFSPLHDPMPGDEDDRQAVLDYLNHYELVSIGIRSKILDGTIYKRWMFGPFIRDWNAASEFIQRERWKWDTKKCTWEYHPKLFEHYQSVACEWSTEAIVLTKTASVPPEKPEGPGDEELPGETEH